MRQPPVALLAEGVDRNSIDQENDTRKTVALLAEGVDRNCDLSQSQSFGVGRPPRGGRG